ncbi:MAG: LLM class flavin-dependent oxidoreductase [Actinobacteria bacterium]|nr:LLM class flavin-dependent oxidoreductase [Actinomycetota bacterium]
MADKREAVLFFFPEWGGMHMTAWRDPEAPADPTMDFATIRQMVQTAERGKFHGFFLADTLAIRHSLGRAELSRTAKGVRFEPMTLMSALSTQTERIGLILTESTTYNEPFHVARQFASLDHLSDGRAGWNVVTSGTPAESLNFGREEHMDHDLRYRRGEEFFEIVTGLWDSWDDDAFLRDKESGVYFHPEAVHQLDHRGEFLSVAGPLNVARPIQGRPLIAQAGSSPVGRAFAARIADAIYTLAADFDKGREFYEEIKGLASDAGRDPAAVKVMPAMIAVVGRTQAEAEERMERLDSLVVPEVGMAQLESILEFDFSGHDLDGPVPEVPETKLGSRGRQQFFLEKARRENLSIRGLMQFAARTGAVAFGPEELADHIEQWVRGEAADGFNVTFGDAAGSLENFVDLVVPELQRRGVFHRDYSGATLRESVGVPRPPSRYAPAVAGESVD